MQKKFLVTYLLIFIILLLMMSVSRHTSEKIRGKSVAFFAPLWENLLNLKQFLFYSSQIQTYSIRQKEEKQELQLENQLLQVELNNLKKQFSEQSFLSSQISQIADNSPNDTKKLNEEYKKFLQRSCETIYKRLQSMPAYVIFRSLDTWNSSLWINVGSSLNSAENEIVAINSPVVIGRAILGIIDYVGKKQSRVRLITDPRLNPSVRASRGGEQDFLLSEQVDSLLQQIKNKKDISLSLDDKSQLIRLLNSLKSSLDPYKKSWYLAKGELLGCSSPCREGQNIELNGTGFNYDFEDEEGDSRDLRSGKSMKNTSEPFMPILKVNDVLVTTGMDGVFPQGFQVAIVTHVNLLKEGDYFYDLKAKPIAGPFEELSLVYVLPPIPEENIVFK